MQRPQHIPYWHDQHAIWTSVAEMKAKFAPAIPQNLVDQNHWLNSGWCRLQAFEGTRIMPRMATVCPSPVNEARQLEHITTFFTMSENKSSNIVDDVVCSAGRLSWQRWHISCIHSVVVIVNKITDAVDAVSCLLHSCLSPCTSRSRRHNNCWQIMLWNNS